MNLSFNIHHTMREKYPNTELFLVRISLYSHWIRRDTEYLPVFSPNAGKHGPKITPSLDTFHAVTNLKYDPRYLCVTRMTQAWNVFLNNFQVLKWFVETKKRSVTESALQFHMTLIRFMFAVHWFNFEM